MSIISLFIVNFLPGSSSIQTSICNLNRSTLSASLQVSNLIVSARENETKHQLTELLNGGRDSQRYRRARFQPLMMKQRKLSVFVPELPFMHAPTFANYSNVHGRRFAKLQTTQDV